VQDSCNEALASEPSVPPPPEAAPFPPEAALPKGAARAISLHNGGAAGNGNGPAKEFEKSIDVLEDLFDKLFHLNKKLELQEEDIFRYLGPLFFRARFFERFFERHSNFNGMLLGLTYH